jgi:cyclohexanecarboxylate-CoA ligase
VQPTRSLAEAGARYRASGVWRDESVASRFAESIARRPDSIAIVDGDRRLTWAELGGAASRFAATLRDVGVGPGDVVSVQLPSWWQTIAISQAVLALGSVLNPIMPSYRQRELSFIINEARPRAVIVPGRYRGVDYPALLSELDLPEHALLTARTGDDADDLVIARAAPPTRPTRSIAGPGRGDDIAALLYTSGTTSTPKGVLHTHNTLLAEGAGIVGTHEITPDDVLMFTMPFGHIGGILYAILVPTLVGNRTVLMDPWDPATAIDLIEREQITVQPGMPVFLRGMLASPGFARARVSSLRLFPMGGSTVAARDVDDARESLGCASKRTYGSTELPTLTTGTASDTPDELATTEGRPIGANEVRIVDADGNDLVPGHAGEILGRGPELCAGYLDARFNAAAFTADGWFRTGDLGTVDATGHLTVVGRLKDIIIRGGENISPKLIEDVLLEHPSVAGVGVVGYPDPLYGERVCAVVATTDADFGFTTMIDYLKGRGLASYQLPEKLLVRAELPYTLTGKLDKSSLRDEAAVA